MFNKDSKILILDDMLTMRKIVKKSLISYGYSVDNIFEAKDGQEGWDLLQNQSVDFIVSDWNMPNLSGLDLLKKVRADEKMGKTPFILLTAESDAAQIKEAIVAGVDNYVMKPFTPASLKEKLEATFKKVQTKAA